MDEDEKLEHMCPQCRAELEEKHCIRCGKTIREEDGEKFINPNFDMARFNRLNGNKDSGDDNTITTITPLK